MNSFRCRLATVNLALITAILGSAALLVGPSVAQAAGSCQSTSLARAASPRSCWAPFSSGSAFDTLLSNDPPLAADSSAVRQHMISYGWTMGPTASGFTLDVGGGSRPVFYASPSDPVMTIHCSAVYGPSSCQGANGVDINGLQIHVPGGARPESNSDAHLTIIETATGDEYDFWRASISGSTITSATGAETNVVSGDGTGSGGDAANLALSAGLLRPSELLAGQIDHPLVLVVPCTNATGAHVGYAWPARGGWGQYCGQFWSEQAVGAPELGQLMKLNMSAAQIASSGAPQWQQTIMTALADYGAYVEDTEGSWHNEGMYILTQATSSWTDLGEPDQWAAAIRAFGQHGQALSSNVPIPASELEVVDTCVTRRTCPNSASATAATRSSSRLRWRHRHLRHATREFVGVLGRGRRSVSRSRRWERPQMTHRFRSPGR
jgi:hypothetical protein